MPRGCPGPTRPAGRPGSGILRSAPRLPPSPRGATPGTWGGKWVRGRGEAGPPTQQPPRSAPLACPRRYLLRFKGFPPPWADATSSRYRVQSPTDTAASASSSRKRLRSSLTGRRSSWSRAARGLPMALTEAAAAPRPGPAPRVPAQRLRAAPRPSPPGALRRGAGSCSGRQGSLRERGRLLLRARVPCRALLPTPLPSLSLSARRPPSPPGGGFPGASPRPCPRPRLRPRLWHPGPGSGLSRSPHLARPRPAPPRPAPGPGGLRPRERGTPRPLWLPEGSEGGWRAGAGASADGARVG